MYVYICIPVQVGFSSANFVEVEDWGWRVDGSGGLGF